ncbi:porin [Pseudacidovorax sp. RU35E]|uniref:porin n=1 Tax=Pseudacidovorax sp. RU35E TaxID=1907403 RepID=UPI000955EFC0|nr:porin [Pseudacidovorax sp. RU35E]SIR56861.1 Outer membrane protein (porin) [Pseudacidovorax sp. RU35E]
MKNTLVALACGALAGAASAQSSVTLFGTIDTGVSYQSATATDPTTGLTTRQSRTSLGNSGYGNSSLGLRGVEDLGGGLAASFWLEAPLSTDDGGSGGLSFTRRSTVSLSGAFGELRLGRDRTASSLNDTIFDPFGGNGSGANLLGAVSLADTGLATNYLRASNMVSYFLPATLGGFYGNVQYAAHENVDSSTSLAGTSDAGRYTGGRFGYANGPLDIALASGQTVVTDNGSLTRTVRRSNLGASYDFGPVKLFGELSNVRDRSDTALASLGNNYNGYLIGATVPVGPGLIRASYGQVRYDEGALAPLYGDAPQSRKLSLGYVHNLSKRTALYATVARISNRNDGAYTGSLSAAATTGYGAVGVGYSGLPKSSTGYDFGIRHNF